VEDGRDANRHEPLATNRIVRRGLLRLFRFNFVLGLLMFVAAGRLDWFEGWIFLGIYTLTTAGAIIYLWRTNPEIVVARSTLNRGGQTAAQKVLTTLLLVSFIAIFAVAGLDSGRFHWSRVPLWLTLIGYVLFLAGMAGNVWALRVNKFAEPVVRIQAERNQKVIDTGPYAIVRHPLYAMSFFLLIGIPLILGALWSLVASAICAGVIVVRAATEDRMLRTELAGYADYAHRVPYRLIPGIW
jgi:protein-S-isoprenylcysteine O-methyltransferase Ste14